MGRLFVLPGLSLRGQPPVSSEARMWADRCAHSPTCQVHQRDVGPVERRPIFIGDAQSFARHRVGRGECLCCRRVVHNLLDPLPKVRLQSRIDDLIIQRPLIECSDVIRTQRRFCKQKITVATGGAHHHRRYEHIYDGPRCCSDFDTDPKAASPSPRFSSSAAPNPATTPNPPPSRTAA